MLSTKKILAIALSLALLICCIPLGVSAEAQIPAINNQHPGVVYSTEGLFMERTYDDNAFTMDWNNGWNGIFLGVFDGEPGTPNPIDASLAEYLEFDIYSSCNLNNEFSLWLSSNTGANEGRKTYSIPALNTGWQHFCLPISHFGNPYGNMDLSALKTLYFEKTIDIADADVTSVNLKVANVAFTKSSPAVNNNYTAIYQENGTFLDRSYSEGDRTMNWGFGWHGMMINGFGGSPTSPTPVDINTAEYLEFDFYSSEDLANGFSVWLSSSTGEEAGRKRASIGDITKGWNHYCLSLGDFGYPYGTLDLSAAKTIFFEATIDMASETAERVNLKVANVSFTKSYPDIEGRLIFGESIFENPSILFNKTVANGTSWDALVMAMNIANGETVDTTDATYIEFDIYSSTDLQSGGAFWITSSFFTESGRRSQGLPALKEGWNHVYYKLDKFTYHPNGEWTTQFDRAAVRGIFFEISPSAVDASVENINLKVANVAFTKDVTSNNTHVTVDSVEGVVHSSNVGAGENLYPNNFFALAHPLTTTDATYIEFDVYATKATDSEFLLWVADNREASTLRAAYIVPKLEEGWNHVCIDVINYANIRDDFEIGWGYEIFQMYNFSLPFFEGVPYNAESEGGQLIFANLSVTKDSDVLVGDANGDTAIDMLDLIALKNVLLGGDTSYNAALDINKDEEITSLDFAAFRKQLFAKF